MSNKDFAYPLLQEISAHFRDKSAQSLNDTYILACQHILEPQFEMFKHILNTGIPKENILIFGKIYSTSNKILIEMNDLGLNTIQPDFNPNESFDDEHRDNCEKILGEFIKKIKSGSKLIIIDDGGELLRVANDSFELIKELNIIGVEQTSSGFRKLENTALNFPIYNVARSVIKLSKESPLIANLGVGRIVDVIKQYEIIEPRILVVGLGPMGSNTLKILSDKGYFTLGYDIAHHEKKELLNLITDNRINIIVGVTGSKLLSEEELEVIEDSLDGNLYLISMSSSDREFPTTYIRKNGIIPELIHGDVVWNKIILINNGFPITFKGNRYESTPEEIERTIALLYGSTLDAMSQDKIGSKGFINVPEPVSDLINKYE